MIQSSIPSSDQDILYLYNKSVHPIHRAWAESVGCEEFREIPAKGINGLLSTDNLDIHDYDIVICEDAFSMRVAALQRMLFRDFFLLRIVAGGGYYNLDRGRDSLKGEAFLSTFVDGAIANSEWIKGYAEQYLDCPIEVVEPFIEDWKYELLRDADYTPDTNEGVFLSRIYRSGSLKGVDILDGAISKINQDGIVFSVNMLGEKVDDTELDAGLLVRGFVGDDGLKDYFESSEVLIQPSRMDSFNIAVLEAFLSGTPAIVSENVGAKHLVAEIDPDLVCEPDTGSLQETISYFRSLSAETKREYSQQCRELAAPYTRENQIEGFKTAFEKVLEEA